MDSTPRSLLQRLRTGNERADWERFVELYSPLLIHWARVRNIPEDQAQDLVQEVLIKLLKQLPKFTLKKDGKFRNWLFRLVSNCWIDQCRKRNRHRQSELPPEADISISDQLNEWTEEEFRQYLTRRAMHIIRGDFSEQVWEIFRLYVLEDLPAAEVAATCEVDPNVVYQTKVRVLKRLKQELEEFLE